MNRLYFGDTRDLFKFDLVRHIMKAVPAFDSFTFIPMLTGTDGGSRNKKSPGKDLAKARKTGKVGSQNQDRNRYFGQILTHIPQKSLIFLDPDAGIEGDKPTEKHLLFDEIKQITNSMDNHSIVMIYQHFPRIKHDGYVRQRCSQLNQLTGMAPLTITDNEILFFLLVKNQKFKKEMEEVLERYANSYPHLTSCTCP